MSAAGSGKSGDRMWSGRFDRPPNEIFDQFQRSFSFDRRLLPYEIVVDRAWARAIERIGILTRDEIQKILAALDSIAARAEREPQWLDASPAEDVHHFVEMALIEALGPLGAKLHTGRSRNELIATDFRLFVKDASASLASAVARLEKSLLDQAEANLGAPMPGMTHMQHGQPILFSHFMLAHLAAFHRDAARIAAAGSSAVSACPMGSGALAGCAFPIDREALARELGFMRPTGNSLDAVSDRDFALEYLFAISALSTHLSRLAEDFVLFASQEFGFVILPDEFATGSSLMPQKKNPDSWELTRGKSGRLIASLVSLLVTMKGLPTSYQRDMQEDKEPVFAAHDQALALVAVAAGAVAATRINASRMRELASDPALLATDAADYLVRKGVPFRQAHEITGKLLREAERAGIPFTKLPLSKLRELSPEFAEDFHAALSLEGSLAAHNVPGGTSPDAVRAAISDWRAKLKNSGARE
ncbi:MAG TPA: argininosuccinate lyase [Candidatus Acidoferrales bacterium]|nr:argininosuccinate lyase [Candidatus Acidoferrales bacterium]